jgi:hypothetical protein
MRQGEGMADPTGHHYYIMGDLHSCCDTLEFLLEQMDYTVVEGV